MGAVVESGAGRGTLRDSPSWEKCQSPVKARAASVKPPSPLSGRASWILTCKSDKMFTSSPSHQYTRVIPSAPVGTVILVVLCFGVAPGRGESEPGSPTDSKVKVTPCPAFGCGVPPGRNPTVMAVIGKGRRLPAYPWKVGKNVILLPNFIEPGKERRMSYRILHLTILLPLLSIFSYNSH